METLTLTSGPQSRCDACSRLQREIYDYKATISNLEEEVNDLYVELMAQKTDSDAWRKQCEDLKARVSLLEKERNREGVIIDIIDSEDDAAATEKKKRSVEENSEDDGKDFRLPTPSLNRKRASRMITSDSEEDDEGDKIVNVDEDYDDDYDSVPIGKLREIRSRGSDGGSRDDTTPSLKRLVKMGEHSAMQNSKSNSMNTRKGSAVRQRLVFVDNDEEKETDDVDSDSMDEFIVSGSESDNRGSDEGRKESSSSDSSSEEDLASDVDLDDVLAMIRRKKDMKKWEYEADMLASFAEDLELCMKAVCALYRQQTSEEQSIKGTLVHNNRGFSQFDAKKLLQSCIVYAVVKMFTTSVLSFCGKMDAIHAVQIVGMEALLAIYLLKMAVFPQVGFQIAPSNFVHEVLIVAVASLLFLFGFALEIRLRCRRIVLAPKYQLYK